MVKIYLSYRLLSSDHEDFVNSIKKGLIDREYLVIDPSDDLMAGDEISTRIEELLNESDVVIQIFSGEPSSNKWFDREVNLANALGKMIIPIAYLYNTESKYLDGIYYLNADHMKTPEIISAIDKTITQKRVKKEILEIKKKETIIRVETNISQYIESSLHDLKKRERNYKISALFWYILGYLSLIAGVAFGFYKAHTLNSINMNIEGLIQLALLSMLLIGLLIGLSKYAFTLGKAYMVESLRNADRSHAISFGDFFIKAFPNDLEWDKVKEVFQHWNIDKGSAFAEQNGDNFDPKLLQTAVEIAKVLNEKKEKK